MYMTEKGLFWSACTLENKPVPNQDWITRKIDQWSLEDPEENKRFLKSQKKHLQAVDLARQDADLIATTGLDSKGQRHYRISDQVSKSPSGDHAVYQANDTFIELRTPFDEKRGLITMVMLSALAGPVGIGVPFMFIDIVPDMLTGIHHATSTPLGIDGYLSYIFALLLIGGFIFAFFYYGHPIIRLETFVQRRILVRFNRQDRTVYVHRPSYAGGIVALPWDKVIVGIKPDDSEASGMGLPLALGWGAEHSPNGVTNLLLVGRLARSNSEISNLWEYIRRYMESDPAQPNPLPTPKRVGKFPWPWRSVMAALSLVWPIFRIRALYWMIPLLLLISPAVLLFAIGHWISLWLCWEPRWPSAIREACNDSLIDTLKPWLIDIGTWAMGAATVYAVVRYLSA